MRYMLAVFDVLLLVTLSFAQQQSQQLPNSPPYGTRPTFPGNPQQQQPPSQMPPDQKAPPPRTMTTNEVEHEIQAHLNTEPALSDTRLDVTGPVRFKERFTCYEKVYTFGPTAGRVVGGPCQFVVTASPHNAMLSLNPPRHVNLTR